MARPYGVCAPRATHTRVREAGDSADDRDERHGVNKNQERKLIRFENKICYAIRRRDEYNKRIKKLMSEYEKYKAKVAAKEKSTTAHPMTNPAQGETR